MDAPMLDSTTVIVATTPDGDVIMPTASSLLRSLLSLAVLFILAPGSVRAAACPHTMVANPPPPARFVLVWASAPNTVPGFIGGPGECTWVYVGGPHAPTDCIAYPTYGLSNTTQRFGGQWAVATTRTMYPSAGCSFMCPGGDCFLRGTDGLPVELMHFGVE